MSAFSEHLQKIRWERELSQEALSKKLEISRSAVSRLEQGLDAPSTKTLTKLCRSLGLSELEQFRLWQSAIGVSGARTSGTEGALEKQERLEKVEYAAQILVTKLLRLREVTRTGGSATSFWPEVEQLDRILRGVEQ